MSSFPPRGGEHFHWHSNPSNIKFQIRVAIARWFVFKPKTPILGKFWRVLQWKSWYILWPFGLFNCNWKYFMAIWYILWSFGIFFPVLVFCTKKNLATLFQTQQTVRSLKPVQYVYFFREKTFVRQNGNQFNDNLCQTMKQKIDCLGKRKKTNPFSYDWAQNDYLLRGEKSFVENFQLPK
jgi:hypothetical protein